MVDNRSAGFYGIGGGFNFKSGDISGTAAKTADDRASQGMEYFALENGEENENQKKDFFVDKSAQLNATLNSLAMMNVANILKNNKKNKFNHERQLNNKKFTNEEFLYDDTEIADDENFFEKYYTDFDD